QVLDDLAPELAKPMYQIDAGPLRAGLRDGSAGGGAPVAELPRDDGRVRAVPVWQNLLQQEAELEQQRLYRMGYVQCPSCKRVQAPVRMEHSLSDQVACESDACG